MLAFRLDLGSECLSVFLDQRLQRLLDIRIARFELVGFQEVDSQRDQRVAPRLLVEKRVRRGGSRLRRRLAGLRRYVVRGLEDRVGGIFRAVCAVALGSPQDQQCRQMMLSSFACFSLQPRRSIQAYVLHCEGRHSFTGIGNESNYELH
ncbi:hypothetical protein BC361_01360 [Ensifer sp. LC54]|nr:hypothetical protein BC363_07880 [Ensifer sp. LC384]OCP28084.1 hypothetical protein BC361_01360 [Ensifer sp. LC54]